MSNFLVIATVTATLRDLLQATAGVDVPGVTVTTARPDGSVSGPQETRVNIYLYQVTPNAAWRNADLPTRRADGTVLQRPQVALDLHYMISFYGDESQLVSQRMLGSVVRTFHAQPFLTRDRIRNTIGGATFPFLATSNLADEVELVKFSPLHLSLEELSKIWSVFFQIPYTLSVAYQGTVVLIESDDIPQSALPVRDRKIYVVPFHQPVIEQIMPQAGANQPITADSTLLILGQRLQGDVTLLRIGGVDVAPAPNDVSQTQISLSLSKAPDLRAGVQGLQVIQQMLMGVPPVPHTGAASDVAPFVLRPIITQTNGNFDITLDLQGSGTTTRSGVVTVRLKPAVGRTQRVVLFLNEISSNPGQPLDHPARAYSFDARPRKVDDPETSDTMTFPVRGISPGTYLVRVQVDGAESLLSTDAAGRYNAPQVTIQ